MPRWQEFANDQVSAQTTVENENFFYTLIGFANSVRYWCHVLSGSTSSHAREHPRVLKSADSIFVGTSAAFTLCFVHTIQTWQSLLLWRLPTMQGVFAHHIRTYANTTGCLGCAFVAVNEHTRVWWRGIEWSKKEGVPKSDCWQLRTIEESLHSNPEGNISVCMHSHTHAQQPASNKITF